MGALNSYNPWGKGDRAFVRLSVTDGGTVREYLAEAARGSLLTEPVWRCWCVVRETVAGNDVFERILHTEEKLFAPGEKGVNLPGLNYV